MRKANPAQWEERFNELAAYKQINGNCNVPRSHGASLGTWVSSQREYYKKDKLSLERVSRLKKMGFNWGTRKLMSNDLLWEEKFKELVAYREKNGDCNVNRRLGALGSWVNEQRFKHKKGKLSQERTAQLNAIKFNWGTVKSGDTWKERFDELIAYKEQNGNCNVNTKNGKLGTWVKNQRRSYKNGSLSKECIERMNKIGFAWRVKGGRKKSQIRAPSDP